MTTQSLVLEPSDFTVVVDVEELKYINDKVYDSFLQNLSNQEVKYYS